MMTPRQARFVEEFLVDGNGTAAAERAGFGARGAHVTASRLLRNPKVAAAIREGQAETRSALKIERETVIVDLRRAYDLAKQQADPAAMVAAAREMARLLGLYDHEHQAVLSTPHSATLAQYEAMSTKELLALLAAN